MKVCADGFSFDFTDALNAFIFDEKDKTKPTYHGQPMKAVDIIAEFSDAYVFVEMKDFDDPKKYNMGEYGTEKELRCKRDHFNWLKNSLKYKLRDTVLFRMAEQKNDKPIHYICLLTLDNALNSVMRKSLEKELPVGMSSRRWKQEIVNSCQVVNVKKWNTNFPKWPLQHTACADKMP
jgi:hypothetical protein